MATTDYGTDFEGIDDVLPTMRMISGPPVVIESLLRRFRTPRGTLWYARNYGTDLRQFINGSASNSQIARAVELECRKDARVLSVSVDVERAENTITITLRLELGDGPFVAVIGVDELTVELLNFSQAA